MFRKQKQKPEIRLSFRKENSQVRIFVDSNRLFPESIADSLYDAVTNPVSDEDNILDLITDASLDLNKLEIILREK